MTRQDKEKVVQFTNDFLRKAGLKRLVCICGRADSQMHHPDYDKPLEVAFLCSRCHTDEHWNRLNKPFIVHDLRDLAVADRVAFA